MFRLFLFGEMMTTLFAAQEKSVQELVKRKRVLASYDVGTGKTLIALEILKRVMKPGDRAVIIVPAMLARNWIAEARKHEVKLDIGLSPLDQVWVLPYTQVEKWQECLFGMRCIIFDESHFLGNIDTQRTGAALRAVRENNPEYLYLLTGTIVRKYIPNIYPALLMLLGKEFQRVYPSYHYFCRKFCYTSTNNYGGCVVENYYGCKDLDGIRNIMRPVLSHLRIEDLGINLPPFEDVNIECTVKLTSEESKLLEDEYNKGGSSVAKKKNALAKATTTIAFLKTAILVDDSPIVVFSDHPEALIAIRDMFKGAVLITGDTPVPARQPIVDQFQQGRIPILCCSIQAAGIGLTLTASHRAVFNDMPWSAADVKQAKARIRRIGQDRVCQIYYVVREGVDKLIMQSIKEKLKLLEKVTGADPVKAAPSVTVNGVGYRRREL